MPPASTHTPSPVFNGVTAALLNERPYLSLDFYSYGAILTKRSEQQETAYAVDPSALSLALADKIQFATGLLHHQTLYVRHTLATQLIVEYRKPQPTGIWIEGLKDPLRVPMPGLILTRLTKNYRNPEYHLYAVSRRPRTLTAPLYHAPLPNVYAQNNICWGNTARADDAALHQPDLAYEWRSLLGSAFGNHSTDNKSKAFPRDIREQLIALDRAKAKRYPIRDLVRIKTTLESALKA